jgi:hypothetical protein
MNSSRRTSILNYETIALLRTKIFYDQETVKDYEIIEDLFEAFGKPRDLILKKFQQFGIYSYEEYIVEIANPSGNKLPPESTSYLSVRTIKYLNAMARYFIKKENIQPEIWELKNPETV